MDDLCYFDLCQSDIWYLARRRPPNDGGTLDTGIRLAPERQRSGIFEPALRSSTSRPRTNDFATSL